MRRKQLLKAPEIAVVDAQLLQLLKRAHQILGAGSLLANRPRRAFRAAGGRLRFRSMPSKHSAGLVVHRSREGGLEVLLVHPGGPYWAKKDRGAWSIPKGEFDPIEETDALLVARREFEEETGQPIAGDFVPLKEIRQAGGKIVRAWAVAGDLDVSVVKSNSFTMEWPPRSGQSRSFPEVDRAEWFPIAEAKERILPGQRPLLEQLEALLGDR
jgi:predicted NUDIX family NTP pyrophosphohydrolase